MSIPIPICRLRKALESEEAFDSLKRDMQANLNRGPLSVSECDHTPQCRPLTDEEWTELVRKIE